MKTGKRCSPEIRERSVRMVLAKNGDTAQSGPVLSRLPAKLGARRRVEKLGCEG